MLTAAEAIGNMLDKQPPGFAWSRDPGSNWGRFYTPAADAQLAFETSAEALVPESTPSSADRMLPDYERVLGPDPCMGPVAVTLQQRRQSVHARWTEQGGASRAHFIGVAAKLGYAITIEEFAPARAGQLRAGGRAYGAGVAFTWRVHAAPPTPVLFRAGSPAGQRLTTAALPLLECNLRRRSPAHTTMIMAFDAPAPVTDDRGVGVTDDTGKVVMA